MQVVSILEVDRRTPVFVLLYRDFSFVTGLQGIMWTKEKVDADGLQSLREINATVDEQKLILRLLDMNKSLLPSGFGVSKTRTEDQFQLSVLLPIGPLEFDAIARLNSNFGCSVCGKKAASKCAQCQSASYCGQGASDRSALESWLVA